MQTTTLETSKLLKEAGFPQETEHCYVERTYEPGLVGNNPDIELIRSETINKHYYHKVSDEMIAYSPTADEILDELPHSIELEGEVYNLRISKFIDGYGLSYSWRDDCYNESLAEAAAKMYFYLRKEGII